jgi:hypothetical protein
MNHDWASRPVEPEILDDPADFTAVVREFERPLGAFLAEILSDAERARDVLQDTFCDAWTAYGRGVAPFTPSRILTVSGDGSSMWPIIAPSPRCAGTG